MTRGVKRGSRRDLLDGIKRSRQNVRETRAEIVRLRAKIRHCAMVIEVEGMLQASLREKLAALT